MTTPAQVAAAQAELGIPYSWGGGGPAGPGLGFAQGADTRGFDCSSLIQYAFAKAGISVPRTTYDQFKAGSAVDRAQLQPGDAVFFTGADPMNGLPGHVGLYIGNGQYIQAPGTGGHVEVASLSGRSDFVGARRYGSAAPAAAATAAAAIGQPAAPTTPAAVNPLSNLSQTLSTSPSPPNPLHALAAQLGTMPTSAPAAPNALHALSAQLLSA